MAQISMLIDIGIILVSLGVGFLFFYFFSYLKKAEKKIQMNEVVSQLVNFIIFLWVGKIVWNLPLFFSDPIAVLAYPSDSKSFYFAVAVMVILLFYKVVKKNFLVIPFLSSFVSIFLPGAMVFEFIQFIALENTYAFAPFLLYFILLILLVSLKKQFHMKRLLIIISLLWSIGMLVLLFIQPFVTVFGYTIHSWFIITVLLASMSGFLYKNQRNE